MYTLKSAIILSFLMSLFFSINFACSSGGEGGTGGGGSGEDGSNDGEYICYSLFINFCQFVKRLACL